VTPNGPDSPGVDDPPSTPPPDIDDELDEGGSAAEPVSAVKPARGPHLPDRWPALLFVGLAAIAAWASYPNPPAWTPETLAAFVLDLLPTVCAVLLPGALLLRHPNAPRAARPLVFGTLLLAATPFLALAGPTLEGWFTTLTPPPEGLEWFIPASIVYGHFHGLLGLFGTLYIAVGLSQTRHWAYRPNGRAAGYAVLGVGVVAALATIYAFTQADLSGFEMTPTLWAYIGASVTMSVLTTLAWAYLAMVLIRCAMSGEEPELGWTSAAIGAGLIVATFAIGAWANLVRTPNETLSTVIFWTTNASYSLGFVTLLLGFVLGMPSLEPVDWAEDDAALDDDEDDDEADLTEDPEPAA
jgi:hypothetical protein